MLGRRSDLAGGEHPYLDHVRRDSFYGFLALHREELFRDEDFADLYCLDNGRPSVSPSLLATALLLQAYEGASDEEAKARADFDLRWKVALGVGLEERPFAKSTLQLFRARLVIHERMQSVLRKSLDYAPQTGYLRSRKLRVVLDTTHVLGRGAVKDTYNLLADGIVMLRARIGRRSVTFRAGAVGARAWPGALLRIVPEGGGGHRLGRPRGAGEAPGKRRGGRGSLADGSQSGDGDGPGERSRARATA